MKLPRVSRKTWIALGLLVVLVAVLLLTTRRREGMENASADVLFTRLQAIKARIQPSGVEGVAIFERTGLLAMFLLAFAKDSVPTTDPAVLTAFESRNFAALKGLKVVDASKEVMGELFTKVEGRGGNKPFYTTLGGFADMIIDELVKPDDTREHPQGFTKADKDAIIAHAKRVFTVTPSGPSPSTPSSSANYSATCNKCTVMNNQITCACDVLPK